MEEKADDNGNSMEGVQENHLDAMGVAGEESIRENMMPDSSEVKTMETDKDDHTTVDAIGEEKVSIVEESEQASQRDDEKNVLNVKTMGHIGDDDSVVRVIIEDHKHHKPFLGGYRNRNTGIEYHHSCQQTEALQRNHIQEKKEHPQITKNHRETQTKKYKSRSQQTVREQGTQMSKPGLFIDDANDKILIPDSMPYFDSEQLHLLRTQKVITIQAYARGWKSRKMARDLKKERKEKKEREEDQERQLMEQERERKRKEIERQVRPRTKRDFEQLYNDLEAWHISETKKIKEESQTDDEKKRKLKELLRRQTKLLQTIDRLKIVANEENKHIRVNRELEEMAKPKTIKGEKETTIMIETPFTVRSRELLDLFHGLNTENLKVDERLDVLLHVKWTVKEFNCRITRDIVELIDRETDMLNRGRTGSSLGGLRRRISNLFLHFCQTPEFNPEAANWNKLPPEYRPPIEL